VPDTSPSAEQTGSAANLCLHKVETAPVVECQKDAFAAHFASSDGSDRAAGKRAGRRAPL